MADSPDLWTPIGALIDVTDPPPVRVDGTPIFDPRFPRWYRGAVHATAIDGEDVIPPPGYFLLGQEFEAEAGCYNGEGGQDGLYRLHCWARTPDDARRLYRWLKRLLHNVKLTVPGYQDVWGTLSKTGPTSDEDGTAWQVEASYHAEPMQAAA